MKIPIKAVRAMAKQHQLSYCVVFGWDGKQQNIATWGRTTEDCQVAADFGNSVKTLLGWPQRLHAEPSRVRALRAKVKELERRLASSEAGKHV